MKVALVPTWLQEFDKEAGYTVKTKWQRFWSNPYKWGLWYWIGGRPWTYIMRDIYHKVPLLVITFGAIALYLIGRYTTQISGSVLLSIIIALFVGILLGHCFWGKKYIPGQGGDQTK